MGMANPGFARGCSMARRLVEQGVSFVEVDLAAGTPTPTFHDVREQAAPARPAMSALIEDLDQRGMLEDTAIVWMGEFGRTPRINGTAGRDHWARAGAWWSAAPA